MEKIVPDGPDLCTQAETSVEVPPSYPAYLRWVAVATLPCLAVQVYRFGWIVLLTLAVVLAVAAALELGVEVLRRRSAPKTFLTTALLFVLVLPPGIPLWMVALGIAFAVLIGKEVFGGSGRHLVNPPLLGLTFLVLSYPQPMLAAFRSSPPANTLALLAILLGGILLLALRVIDWRIVVGILGSFVALAISFDLFSGPEGLLTILQTQLLAGGLLFGTFFLATDPVTSPPRPIGRLLFGILIGVGAVFLRRFSVTPDDAGVAILVANVLAPFLARLDRLFSRRSNPEMVEGKTP